MRNILYLFISFILIGCGYDYCDDYESTIKKPEYINIYDTLRINKKITKLPYQDDNIKVYSDSCYNTIVYNNHYLYVDVLSDYKISDIDIISNDMYKTIELTHTAKSRVYWCAADVKVDSISVILTTIIKKKID